MQQEVILDWDFVCHPLRQTSAYLHIVCFFVLAHLLACLFVSLVYSPI